MRRLQVGAALLILASPSYAWSAPPKGLLGGPMPAYSAEAAPSGRAPPARLPARASGRSAQRFEAALGALQPEGRPATRGAKEVQVYQTASPAVVLVVTDDAIGSGALISADGKIITNLHVVGDNDEVGVVFKPKSEGAEIAEADVRTARVIRRDQVADLALLQVSEAPADVTPLALGSSATVQVGADVHAIGHPTGETWTYTRGIVSQIRKDFAWTAEDKVQHKATVIQTQTPINPGNSGGPLIDDSMAIVGINSFIGEGEGINFAVSADDVKAFLSRTTDRMAQPVTNAKKKVASKACKPQTLRDWPFKDPAGTAFLIDSDCDGEGDFVAIEPDKASEAIIYYFDEDDDGKIEAMLFDEDRDGDLDFAFYDTDGDGDPDMKGEFKPGEIEPYRFERLED